MKVCSKFLSLLLVAFVVHSSYNEPKNFRAIQKLQDALALDKQAAYAHDNYVYPQKYIPRPATAQEIDRLVKKHKKLEEEERMLSEAKHSKFVNSLHWAKNIDTLLSAVDYKDERFEQPFTQFRFADRDVWTAACKNLPSNSAIMSGATRQSAFLQHPAIKNKVVAWHEFALALEKAFDAFTQGELADQNLWTSGAMPSSDFYTIKTYDTKKIVKVFEPYVQKLDTLPGDKIFFHGDLHGDIHSLMHMLTWLENRGYLERGSFKLAHSNVYLVFLGDYVDCGYYGAEVIYTLLRLKIANRQQVIMVRGNHEDTHVHMQRSETFADELAFKFRPDKDVEKLTTRLYNFLPVALYVGHGNDYLQCCHGGIEHGYKPAHLLQSRAKFDLLGELKRYDAVIADDYTIGYHMSKLQADRSLTWLDSELAANFTPEALSYQAGTNFQGDIEWRTLGFSWFDFAKFGSSFWHPGRGLVADKALTQAVLDYQNQNSKKKVRGIFRAHQHTPFADQHNSANLMAELLASKGVHALWQPIETEYIRSLHDGLVWTFNAAPDLLFGEKNACNFDAFAMLRVAQTYEAWQLVVYNL